MVESDVDYQDDNADDVGHLNYLGNQKYTKYLGTYIKEHYTVVTADGRGL